MPCGSARLDHDRPAIEPSECRAAIEGFASADPATLRALPASCTLADVAAALHSLAATADGLLGAPVAAFDIHVFASDKSSRTQSWCGPNAASS